MPAAMAIPAAIQGVSSLVGAIKGSSAAKSAAATQAAAAAKVAQMATDASQQAASGVNTAAQNATTAVQGATGQANDILGGVFATQGANLNPYLQAGQQGVTSLMAALAPGGSLTQQFNAPTADEAAATPGYQFTMGEAMKALQRSQAARGALSGGGALRDLTKYGEGVASTYYQNTFDNALKTFQTNRTNAMQGLGTLAQLGQFGTSQYNAAAQNFGNQSSTNLINSGLYTGNTDMTAAQYGGNTLMQGTQIAANALMGGANAQAAGTVGSANAIQNGIAGIGNAASYVAGRALTPSSASTGTTGWGVPTRAFLDPSYLSSGTAPASSLFTVPSYLSNLGSPAAGPSY